MNPINKQGRSLLYVADLTIKKINTHTLIGSDTTKHDVKFEQSSSHLKLKNGKKFSNNIRLNTADKLRYASTVEKPWPNIIQFF